MADGGNLYQNLLKELEDSYVAKVQKARNVDELLSLGVELYGKRYDLNVKAEVWDSRRGYDHDAIYFTALFLIKYGIQAFQSNVQSNITSEAFKGQLAQMLFQAIDSKRKVMIHVVEPHPDDALGSASGLCYCDRASVKLHTICKTGDGRDAVKFPLNLRTPNTGESANRVLKKEPNIVSCSKYGLPDLHWDNRLLGHEEPEYQSYIDSYSKLYGTKNTQLLESHIKKLIEDVKKEGSYIAVPLGIEHPMHMLVADVCMKMIVKGGLDSSHVIVYVDHPYDYQNAGNGRTQLAIEHMKTILHQLNGKSSHFVRYDEVKLDQSLMDDVVRAIYGKKYPEAPSSSPRSNEYYSGDFAGSLSQTYCSLFIEEEAAGFLKNYLNIHVNNVLYITAQAWPFMKTGGSGEVAYSFCKVLKDYVNDIRIIMPDYTGYETSQEVIKALNPSPVKLFDYVGHSSADGTSRMVQGSIKTRDFDGIRYYLIGLGDYFSKRRLEHREQQGEIFAAFCDAVLCRAGAIHQTGYMPTVFHCNDWQTAMIPFLAKVKYPSYWENVKTIYTIHFYGYRGIFSKQKILHAMGVDDEDHCKLCIMCNPHSTDCLLNHMNLLSNDDMAKLSATPYQMSFMKTGIHFSDHVTTVSEGYADELKGYPDFRGIRVTGIRNGIVVKDTALLPNKNRGASVNNELLSFLENKKALKAKLQKELGLEVNSKIPVICMVSRLTLVKGIDSVKNIMSSIISLPAQLVIVGNDDESNMGNDGPYSDFFRKVEASSRFKGSFSYRRFEPSLEFRTYAGSDIVLMPSLSEACGTTQMLAMSYGTVPIVSMVSGFRDTVLDFKERRKKADPANWGKGIGFYAFKEDCWVLLEVIKKAVEIYSNADQQGTWNQIALDCTKVDFSWKNNSIVKYLKLYNSNS